MNLFLQLKVSDKNSFKIQSIDLSSFEMRFLSRCYITQAQVWKVDSQFGCAFDQIYNQTKDRRSSKSGFLTFDVLSIDSILRVSVYVHALRSYRKEVKHHNIT